MDISILLKKILSIIIFKSGIIDRKLNNYSGQDALILMYHRILPEAEINRCIQPGMFVKPATFELHLQFLKQYFQIMPLSDMSFNPKRNIKKVNNKPSCIITFDDGWQDFYKYAFPLLNEYKVPATVFLPTKYIGTNRRFWTDQLAHLLLNKKIKRTANKLTLPTPVVQELERLNGPFEIQLDRSVEILKRMHHDKIYKILKELSDRWSFSQVIPGRAFLSWDEVREMASSGFVTIGSHTVNHSILTTLNVNEIQEEIIQSKERLISENVVEKSFIPFCYPNGDHDEQIVKIVKATGYNIAVTTQPGWNNFHTNPFMLNRIGIHQDMASSKAMLGCRVVDIFSRKVNPTFCIKTREYV